MPFGSGLSADNEVLEVYFYIWRYIYIPLPMVIQYNIFNVKFLVPYSFYESFLLQIFYTQYIPR